MLQRLKQELKRLCCTKQTWLLVAVMVFGPILITTDFFGWGTRAYDTTISNVLMLNPARLSLYISAFSIMVFTLLQLRQLYDSSTYTILEATVDPLTQIVLQTIAIGIIMITSVCVSLLVLYPYTALTMGTLFSFLKFIRTWVYIYLLGMLITLLISSGIFLIFRNFEASLILMSALMLFSISRPVESYYLTHWLQTAVTSIADGTESTLRFRIMLYTRLVGMLAGITIHAVGLLCVRRYSKRIFGSVIQNVRHAVIPLLLVVSIATCGFYTNNDPFYGNDETLLTEYAIEDDTQTVEYDTSTLYSEAKSESDLYNYEIRWKEMNVDTTIESDRLDGKVTYLLNNISEEKDAQTITIRMRRGIKPSQVFCDGEPIDFYMVDLNFLEFCYYSFTLPAGLEDMTLEILFEGYPKGAVNSTELSSMISAQYVELSNDYIYLMIIGTIGGSAYNTINLPEEMTLVITETETKEIESAREGYRTYIFTDIFGETSVFYYILAGDYLMETTSVGDLEIEFLYFRNKAEIYKEIDTIRVIKDIVTYFTDLYGPLNFDGKPLIVAETERNGFDVWQIVNFCGINESALVSSLYQTEDTPDAARSIGLQSLVEVIARQWWSYGGGALIEYNLQAAFTKCNLYLYIKHLYGDAYAEEALVEPWYQTAKYQQNAFYWCNKQYTSILPAADAAKVYLPYQEQERKYIYTVALLRAKELVGGEEALLETLVKIYNEWNKENFSGYQTYPYLDYELLLVKLGITQEEFEAW